MRLCSDCPGSISQDNKSGRCRKCSSLHGYEMGRRKLKPLNASKIRILPRNTNFVERRWKTMSKDTAWPYSQAWETANELKDLLSPACELIVIAGSLRRKKQTVHDIEILAAPKVDDTGVFHIDKLDEAIMDLMARGVLDYRLNVKGSSVYGAKNKLLVHLPTGIPVDVFSADIRNFGVSLVVRTGSAEFNIKLMARLKALGKAGHAYPKEGHGGVTREDGTEVECPHEDIVFREAGWDFIEPEKREVTYRDRAWKGELHWT